MHKPIGARGRPREFNMNLALDRAILYFRAHGYHGVSIANLSQALKLSAGSIYKAFHNKHALFTAALNRYIELRRAQLASISASEASGCEKLRQVLLFFARSAQAEEGRYGCLVVLSAVELASTDKAIAAKVAAQLQVSEQLLQSLLEAGQADGSIAQTVDVAATAKLLLAVIQGMRVLGKVGQSQQTVESMAATAMKLLD